MILDPNIIGRFGNRAPRGVRALNKRHLLARGLVGAYAPFAKTSSSKVTRELVGADNLTEVGASPTQVATRFGVRATQLNSNDEYLRVTAPSRIVDAQTLATVTLHILVRRLGAMAPNAAVGGVNYANPHASPWTTYLLGPTAGQTDGLTWFTANGGSIRVGPSGTLPLNQWTWVTATQESGAQRMFFDGIEVGTATTFTGPTWYSNGWVGLGEITASARNPNCEVAFMLIWNRVLSERLIRKLRNFAALWGLFADHISYSVPFVPTAAGILARPHAIRNQHLLRR